MVMGMTKTYLSIPVGEHGNPVARRVEECLRMHMINA